MLLQKDEYTSRNNGQPVLEDGNGLEPIAIIGMGCRFPGEATDPSKLWNLLSNGKSAWSKGPEGRYSFDGFRDPDRAATATTNTNGGHFLSEDIAAFDAAFFGLHAGEASAMDPQQRIMLEVAYEAFENAGVSTQHLSDSNTGVYVGQWTCDYAEVLARDPEYPATYHATGAGPAITSNRISYQFNLKGPSFTVDTGCSASLVALHMAVQSLRSGETDMSLVGGVNLLVDPQRFIYQSKLKMFSNDGKSYAFDHRAKGYGRGEGCSGVVLKPLSKALRDGDHIRGIVRNSVLNQDGKTSGISVPSGDAQEKAIRKAYADAGLDLWADYIEAHGTGTAIGDPIETEAIASALSKHRDADYRLPIGSIKGNIGHTESAAGLAGLVKSVLMLENGSIPPQANFEKINEKILLEDWRIRVPTELERKDLRRISLNSFGYGGTNAHVILDSARRFNKDSKSHVKFKQTRTRAFIISAASEKSFKLFAEHLVSYLEEKMQAHDSEFLDGLAYTLNRRMVYKHRVAIMAEDENSLKTQLETLLERPIPPTVMQPRERVAFVFSGQGAQYYNMGRELINTWPEFTASLQRANKHLKSLGCPYDVMAELQRDAKETNVNEPRFGQPLSTAIQLALVNQLAALNVRPTTVAGHSSGEIAAAYAAGFLSFEDAMSISYHRGRLVSDLLATLSDTPGGMLAVGSSSGTVEHHIADLGDNADRVKVVCYNSPSSVTVAGDLPAIEELSKALEGASIFNRVLRTNGAAYHSDQMQKIEQEYRKALESTKFLEGSGVMMVSSLRGGEVDASEINQDYWAENLISPVLFEDAVWEISQLKDGIRNADVILEVGPHCQLEGPVKQTLQSLSGASKDIAYTSVLKRNTDAAESFLRCLSSLHEGGIETRLHHANNGFKEELPPLLHDAPAYAFDHERTFWHESRLSKEFKNRKHLPHELLGNLAPDYNSIEPRWRRYLNLKELPWLENHVVQGQTVFPAAGYLAMAVEAGRRHLQTYNPTGEISGYRFHNISIGKALVLDKESADHEISLALRPEARSSLESSATWMEFRIFTVAENKDWTEHCRGSISVELVPANSSGGEFGAVDHDIQDVSGLAIENLQEINREKFYYLSRDIGLDWKQPFDNVSKLHLGPEASVYDITVPEAGQDAESGPSYAIHPGTLDAALFHGLCSVLLFRDHLNSPPVPTHIRDLYISAEHHDKPGNLMTCYTKKTDGPKTFDVVVKTKVDGEERIVLSSNGIIASQLPGDVADQSNSRQLCHSVRWAPYTECMTAETMNSICKASVTPGSVEEENRVLNDIVTAYINEAYGKVSPDQIPDDYRRTWYEWMDGAKSKDLSSNLPSSEIPEDIDLGVAGEAVSRIGPNMADILKGEADPLAILNTGDLLTRIYSDERCDRCYSQISAFLVEFAKQNPGMKALEAGAGTGSAAEPTLDALLSASDTSVSSYDFTDISPAFFESAQTKLSRFEKVLNYKTFDVNKDPAEQGFEAGSYDLVLACNVIHATPSLDNSLENIRSLLRPGGVFILMEITREQLYYNLIFGSLPGWWLGSTEGRVTSPLLSPERWIELLNTHKFNTPAALLNDYEESAGGTITCFVSSAAEDTPTSVALPVEVLGVPGVEKFFPSLATDIHRTMPSLNISSVEIQTKGRPGAISIFPPEVCEMFAGEVPEAVFNGLRDRLLQSKIALMVTRGGNAEASRPQSGIMNGFARSFRCENPDLRIITLDLDVESSLEEAVDAIHKLFQSPSFDLAKDTISVENEFAVRNGQLLVARITHEKEMDEYIRSSQGSSEAQLGSFLDNDRHLMASLGVPGLLETIRWADIEDLAPLGDDEVELDLRAASINFKDVLIAAGQLEGITEMKNDCSGVITAVGKNMQSRFTKGDRVCCYYSRSYTNRPRVHGDCCAVIPESVSFETAASLPIVWATVYHSLVDRGRLAKGESLLVHSAAGAVGQAAIILAKHLGAEVYATVGSAEKKKFLIEKYGVREDHIFSSRNTAFGKAIRSMTPNGGVDVVLNSLAGDVFRETCNTVAPYGRFVEIGRKQFMDDMLMPSRFFLKNITFSYVDLALMIEETKSTVRRLLEDVIRLMGDGSIQPTTIKTMPISEIEAAFRMIQAGKHMGKLILTVEEKQEVKIVPKKPELAQLKADGSYVVVGGLGGLGQAIIRWMAARGARQIITLSRSGNVTAANQDFIDEMKAEGVSVLPKKCNVAILEEVRTLFDDIEKSETLSPLHGVIQSAMAIHDAMLSNMTNDQWTGAVSAKITGSWNIHTLLPHSVDFFLLMSSAVALSGNPGQTNYGAACAYQDALARHRSQLGRPAYSINVGAVVDTGFVSENPEIASALRRQGLGTITSAELLAKLNYAILHPVAASPEEAQCSIGLIPAGNERGLGVSTWLEEARFKQQARSGNNVKMSSEGSADLLGAISGAKNNDEALASIAAAIVQQLSKLIATPVEYISDAGKLDDYGVDSLVAVELRNWIAAYLQANISILTMRNAPSIKDLAGLVAKNSKIVSAK